MAVMIGLMMLTLALPSMRGLFGEQRLRDRMGEFEGVVLRAAALARSSGQEVRLRWVKLEKDKQGLWMGTSDGSVQEEGGAENGVVLDIAKDEKIQLRRLAARKGVEAPAEWCFWPNGIREPVEVSYQGPAGEWSLRFGALLPDPEVLVMRPK